MRQSIIPNDILKTIIGLIIVTLVGISVGLWLTHTSNNTDAGLGSKAVILESPRPLSIFELSSHPQSKLDLDVLKGKWTLLFFGYTHCPDVCPVTLAELGRMFKQIKTEPELANTQAVFISVDPERDTPEKLAAYVEYFDPDFIGATGTIDVLNNLTSQLGIRYSRATDTGNAYIVNHTSAVLLIDPEARYYAYLLPPHYAEEIYNHYTAIRAYYRTNHEGK